MSREWKEQRRQRRRLARLRKRRRGTRSPIWLRLARKVAPVVRRRFVALGTLVAAVALVAVGLVFAPTASATPPTTTSSSSNGKVYVCKYVGKPGVDERLQTGQNPIDVSVNSIKSYHGVGSYFNDAQGRSYVLAVDNGQPTPPLSDCPAAEGGSSSSTPPSSTTTSAPTSGSTAPTTTTSTSPAVLSTSGSGCLVPGTTSGHFTVTAKVEGEGVDGFDVFNGLGFYSPSRKVLAHAIVGADGTGTVSFDATGVDEPVSGTVVFTVLWTQGTAVEQDGFYSVHFATTACVVKTTGSAKPTAGSSTPGSSTSGSSSAPTSAKVTSVTKATTTGEAKNSTGVTLAPATSSALSTAAVAPAGNNRPAGPPSAAAHTGQNGILLGAIVLVLAGLGILAFVVLRRRPGVSHR